MDVMFVEEIVSDMAKSKADSEHVLLLDVFFRELIEAIVVLGAEVPCKLTEEQKIPQLSSLARVLVEGYRQQARSEWLSG